jgi:hypothetical protein
MDGGPRHQRDMLPCHYRGLEADYHATFCVSTRRTCDAPALTQFRQGKSRTPEPPHRPASDPDHRGGREQGSFEREAKYIGRLELPSNARGKVAIRPHFVYFTHCTYCFYVVG